MLRIFAFVCLLAKRLDARLTRGVDMHGRCLAGLSRCLAGLSRSQSARRLVAGRRQPLKNHALTLAMR